MSNNCLNCKNCTCGKQPEKEDTSLDEPNSRIKNNHYNENNKGTNESTSLSENNN